MKKFLLFTLIVLSLILAFVSCKGNEQTPTQPTTTQPTTQSTTTKPTPSPENPEHEHVEVIIPAVEATCTQQGLTKGKICADCGEILVVQEKTPLASHTEDIIPAVAATCTTSGLSEGKLCAVCGEILVEQNYVEVLGHKESDEWIYDKMPTETENGYKSKKCSVCGETTTVETIVYTDVWGLEFVVNDDGKTCTITGIGTFKGDKLEIPEYIAGYEVTNIGDSAFSRSNKITELILPKSIKTIGAGAFNGCSSLKSVTLGGSITEIKGGAFSGCSSLIDVYFVGDVAGWLGIKFENAGSNPAFVNYDGVYDESYIKNLYFNNELVREIVIPEGIEVIGDHAFRSCTSLVSVVIPDSVVSIGYCAFYYCTSLESVTFGNSVTTIGRSSFSHCPSLKSVVIPASVTTIEHYAFGHSNGDRTFYCEAARKPEGWENWNPDNNFVIWGYKGE